MAAGSGRRTQRGWYFSAPPKGFFQPTTALGGIIATDRILSHFATFRSTQAFWDLPEDDRGVARARWCKALEEAAGVMHWYQVCATEAAADVMAWSTVRLEDGSSPNDFFRAFAAQIAPFRSLFDLQGVLWGYTQPSEYRRGRSTREIDPFGGSRLPYLFVYPFVKTKEWYLLPADQRQTLMREHIQVGKTHQTVTQLLLYSFGLQDHEFVVVYEADDVTEFSALVRDLRSTEVRKYTERDTPLHVGLHRTRAALCALDG